MEINILMMENNSSNKSKVLHGISSQTLVVFMMGIVEIISFSIMSRLLSKEDFGYCAALGAIISIFATFADTGIGSALVQRKNLDEKYVNNAFTLSLIFGLLVTGVLILSSGLLANIVVDKSMKIPLMIMSVSLLCSSLISVNFSLMQRKLQFMRIGLINLSVSIFSTIVAVILALNDFGYYAVIIKGLVFSVSTLIISYFYIGTKLRLAFNIDTLKTIWNFSGWLMFSSVFRNIKQQTDRLMMSRLLSVTSLGAYNRPKEFIIQISSRLNGIFDTALFPILSSIQDEKEKMANAYKKSLYYMNIFTMLLALGFIVNSKLIIRIFFGEEWLNITLLFVVLSLNLLFNADGRLTDCYFRSLGLTKQQFYFRILEMVITIVCIVIGAIYYDLMGVAIAFTISNIVMILFKLNYLRNRIDVSLREVFYTIISAWKFSLFVIPLFLLVYILLPDTFFYNIINLLFFICVVMFVFILMPKMVGKRYEEEIALKIKELIRKKAHF